jgi:hypothetical protein
MLSKAKAMITFMICAKPAEMACFKLSKVQTIHARLGYSYCLLIIRENTHANPKNNCTKTPNYWDWHVYFLL